MGEHASMSKAEITVATARLDSVYLCGMITVIFAKCDNPSLQCLSSSLICTYQSYISDFVMYVTMLSYNFQAPWQQSRSEFQDRSRWMNQNA